MLTRTTCATFALAALSGAVASPVANPFVGPRAVSGQTPLAPLTVPETDNLIENSYIVMLKPGVDTQSMFTHLSFLENANNDDSLGELDSGLRHVYDAPATKGYAGRFSPNTVERIRAQPEVAYIEQDQMVWALNYTTQKGAPWGLARISHRTKLRFGTFNKYEYDPAGGEGIDAYVIDTGINVSHNEFEGRAKWGKTIPKNDVDEDGNGHGTHCAGTIASKAYGVAKAANVIAVKVLASNGSGSMSDVLAGVTWAARTASEKAAAARAELAATGYTAHKGSVANMSLGGGKSPSLDAAVDAAVQNGMLFAVAAGNDNKDACGYSPAASEKAVTVGASTLGDERAYFSNWGKCVDVFAPGLNILSTWIGSPRATNTISGTSMASPHTAGLLAYFLSLKPEEVLAELEGVGALSEEVLEAFEIVDPMFGSVMEIARRILPSWVGGFLPSRKVSIRQDEDDFTPIPGQFSPKQLKKVLLDFATAGALTDLPKDTPNLLIFNNAPQY